MTIDGCLAALGDALRVRGVARRRFLRECRDHLVDAAADRGEAEAVRAFGPPDEIAAAFDAEIAARRGIRSTVLSAAGVAATGASTLALVHSADPGTTAPTVWAIVFFVAAQIAAVSAGLAVLQALATRRLEAAPAGAALLARRNGCGLLAAGLTMFAAGAALPGHGSASILLAGPLLVCAAAIAVLRAGALARRLPGSHAVAVRSPLDDLRQLTSLPLPSLAPDRLLVITVCVAGAAAFARDLGEDGRVGQAAVVAAIEAAAVAGCWVALGPALGLRRR